MSEPFTWDDWVLVEITLPLAFGLFLIIWRAIFSDDGNWWAK